VDALNVSGGTVTVPVTYASAKIQNNAATGAAITITTSGAVDGQSVLVRFFDYSAVAQGITWANTENGATGPPAISKGVTGAATSAGFIFNGYTTKWTCMAAG
jgi:hypothetical protein